MLSKHRQKRQTASLLFVEFRDLKSRAGNNDQSTEIKNKILKVGNNNAGGDSDEGSTRPSPRDS